MNFEFPSGLAADFHLSLAEAPGRWDVTCTGTLDVAEAAAVIQPQLLKLHAAAIDAKLPVVALHLEDVEYMNSSGLKSFMVWFLTASNARRDRYTIEVSYDPDRSWQLLSLRPMERLAPDTVKLRPHRTANGAAS